MKIQYIYIYIYPTGRRDGIPCPAQCLKPSHQVTEKSVRLIDCLSKNLLDSWEAPASTGISIAAINPSQVLVATRGANLVYFELKNRKIVLVKHVKLDHEIACLDIRPLENDSQTTFICAVGLWDITLRILSLPNLQQLSKEDLGGEFLPRSVLFANFADGNYVLCGLGNGYLYSFNFEYVSGQEETFLSIPIYLPRKGEKKISFFPSSPE